MRSPLSAQTAWSLDLGRRFYAIQAVVWLAFAVSSYAAYFYVVREEQRLGMLRWDVVRMLFGVLITTAIAHGVIRLLKKGVATKRVVILALAASPLLAVFWYLSIFAVGLVIRSPNRMPDRFIPPWLAEHTVILLAWTACFLAVVMWRRSAALEHEAYEIRDRAQRAKLEALSHQIRPHFLFNSLNSLRSLIHEDNPRARDMVTGLSEFLRYTLQSRPGELVPLGEELEALERYLEVEQERFEDSLHFDLEATPEAERIRVPELLLLPLIENAVTHGISQTRDDVEIRLRATLRDNRLAILVENAGSLGQASSNGAGIGLENVRRRLELHYPDNHSMSVDDEAGRVTAQLDLPVDPR